MALIDSLAAAFELNEPSGTRADAHAGNTLFDHGSVLSAAGKIGPAALFTRASNSYLEAADTLGLSIGAASFTIAGWVYAETLTNVDYCLWAKGTAADPEYYLQRGAGGGLAWTVTTGPAFAGYTFVAPPVTLVAGTWYFVVCWYDAAAAQIGIQVNNGTPTTAAPPTAPFDGPGTFQLGNYFQYNQGWDGRLDQVYVWKRMLTTQERTDLYNGGAGLPYSGLSPLPSTKTINLGDNWQAAVDAGVNGDTFLIAAGTHRLQSVNPKFGQSFIGQGTAVMSGSVQLASASFTNVSGSNWRIGGQTQNPGARTGFCAVGYSGCNYCEELFINGVRQRHAETLAEVANGVWFFDYSADQITIGENPAGKLIETSITTWAFTATGNNVTIRNLTIQHYASLAQYGAINMEGASGWIIEDNIFINNHSGGIRIGSLAQIRRNKFFFNGHEGIVGIGDSVLVEDNEIAYNNAAHFEPLWEGGGTKFVLTHDLIFRRNYVHHNYGPGIWGDIDNERGLIEYNVSVENEQYGIMWEVSWSCVIRYNQVRNNGFASWVPANYIWGAGILCAASTDVEVYGNVVENNAEGICAVQQPRGDGVHGTYLVSNFYVHHNIVKQQAVVTGTTGWNGVLDGVGDPAIFTSRNNRYLSNHYELENTTNYFSWNGGAYLDFGTWQSFGLDSTASGGAATVMAPAAGSQAFDAATWGGATGGTSQTTAHTVGTGANRLLLIGALGDAVSNVLTGATYNGVAATLITAQNASPGAVYWQHLWYLLAPASGTHNVVVTASTGSNIQTAVASYSGVLQTAPEVSTTNSGGGDPYVTTLTTTSPHDWTAEMVNASVGLVNGSGFTGRAADGSPVFSVALGDSAGTVGAAGSKTLAVNGGGGVKQSIMIGFAPAAQPAAGVTCGIVGGPTIGALSGTLRRGAPTLSGIGVTTTLGAAVGASQMALVGRAAVTALGLVILPAINVGAVCHSFRSSVLMGLHAFGPTVVRVGTAADTFKGALYLTTATRGASDTAYTTAGEVSGTGYTAGGMTVTNGTNPAISGAIGYWTPSANLVWTTVTLSTAFDCLLLYNTTAAGQNAVGTFVFPSQIVIAGTFTLQMPSNTAATGLVRLT